MDLPYEEILIDEQKGQVIGLWHQIPDAPRADGSHYEIAGIGGSWSKCVSGTAFSPGPNWCKRDDSGAT